MVNASPKPMVLLRISSNWRAPPPLEWILVLVTFDSSTWFLSPRLPYRPLPWWYRKSPGGGSYGVCAGCVCHSLGWVRNCLAGGLLWGTTSIVRDNRYGWWDHFFDRILFGLFIGSMMSFLRVAVNLRISMNFANLSSNRADSSRPLGKALGTPGCGFVGNPHRTIIRVASAGYTLFTENCMKNFESSDMGFPLRLILLTKSSSLHPILDSNIMSQQPCFFSLTLARAMLAWAQMRIVSSTRHRTIGDIIAALSHW